MMYPLFAFDNYFKNTDRDYPPSEQWDLLRETGYAKAYLSVGLADPEAWSGFLDMPNQRRRTGLGLAAVYTVVDLVSPAPPDAHTPDDLLNLLEPGDTLELALTVGWKIDRSDPKHDDRAAAFLAPLLDRARTHGVTISLYHHLGFWQERIEDCVRLAALVDEPELRVTFCGYHWYACDRADLTGKLQLAAPWLRTVNLCGSRPAPRLFAGSLPATIEPVGDGDFPLDEYIAGLRAIGYAGDVGFQGYRLGGYPPVTLRRSLEAFLLAESA